MISEQYYSKSIYVELLFGPHEIKKITLYQFTEILEAFSMIIKQKQKLIFSSHIMKFVNNNTPVRSTNILIIIIPFLVLLAQPRILQAESSAETRTQYSWGGPGDRYIRVNGNTEVTRKTKNSTTKTTVNIPQQFINTLSQLAKNGQGGLDLRILPSQLQSEGEKGTKKFMVLTNNSLAALAALKESSLVPIVTKVTALNDSNESKVKISEEKIGGAYDMDTGKIVYFNKQGQIENMALDNGSIQKAEKGDNKLNANQLANNVKTTASPLNTKTTVKSSIDTPKFQQSTTKLNQSFQSTQSASSSLKNNSSSTLRPGAIQTGDRQKQQKQKNMIPSTNQIKPPNQLGSDFYGGSNSYPTIGSAQTVPNSSPYPSYPSDPASAIFPNQIGPSPSPYSMAGTIQNNNQLARSLEYNAYLNSLNQPVQVIREVTPFIVYVPITNAPNSLNINPYQKDSGDKRQLKQANNKLQIKTAEGKDKQSKKEQQNLPFGTKGKQDQSLSNSLIQRMLPELVKYGQLNTNYANTANISKLNQQKNISINIQNNDQTVNFSIPSNNSINSTSVKNNNDSSGSSSNKPPVPSLIGTPDFSIKIEQATKGSNNYTDITGKSSSFSQVDSLNHHITVLAVSTGRFGNYSVSNNSIKNQDANNNASQKIANNDIKISAQKPNEGRNVVKAQISKVTQVKGVVTPIILNKTSADTKQNKTIQNNSIQIEQQKKQNARKLSNQNMAQNVNNNKIKVEQILGIDQIKNISPIQLTFRQYRQKYKPRQIATEQSSFKQMIYSANIRKINDHNLKVAKLAPSSAQKPTYLMGLNQFTDLSQQQFYKTRLNLVIPPDIKTVAMTQIVLLPKNQNGQLANTVPEKVEINWSCHSKDQNATFIDQGQCGASYVIAPLQSVQISIRMYGLNVQNLSVQQVLSCQPRGRFTNGCFSGFYLDTFDYLKGIGVGQNQYPYDSKSYRQGVTPECNLTAVKTKKYLKSKVFIQRSQRIPYGDCRQIVNRLQKKALTAAIVAREGFQFYQTGMYSIKRIKGSKYEVDSTVTIVGYHPAKGYLIKNSWGDTWGQKGYAYVSDTSGICDFVIQPILAENMAGQPKPRKCV